MKLLLKTISFLLSITFLLSACTKDKTADCYLCGTIEDWSLGKDKIVKLCYIPDSGLYSISAESFGSATINSNGSFSIVTPTVPTPDKLVKLDVIFGNGLNISNPAATGARANLYIFENEASTDLIGDIFRGNNLYGLNTIGPGSCYDRHIYVDKDVHITGTGIYYFYLDKFTMICDLDFKAGWNNYYMELDSISHYKVFMNEPFGLKWFYWHGGP